MLRGEASESSGECSCESGSDDELDWHRGDKLLSNDGSVYARRILKSETTEEKRAQTRPFGVRRARESSDDVLLQVRTSGGAGGAFCGQGEEGRLSSLPWERMLLRLSEGSVGEAPRQLWFDCLRRAAVGDCLRLSCSSGRAREWIEAFMLCASQGSGLTAQLAGDCLRKGSRAVFMELQLIKWIPVALLHTPEHGLALLMCLKPPEEEPPRPPDRVKLRVRLVGEGEGEAREWVKRMIGEEAKETNHGRLIEQGEETRRDEWLAEEGKEDGSEERQILEGEAGEERLVVMAMGLSSRGEESVCLGDSTLPLAALRAALPHLAFGGRYCLQLPRLMGDRRWSVHVASHQPQTALLPDLSEARSTWISVAPLPANSTALPIFATPQPSLLSTNHPTP